jgi:hypothetical protein
MYNSIIYGSIKYYSSLYPFTNECMMFWPGDPDHDPDPDP